VREELRGLPVGVFSDKARREEIIDQPPVQDYMDSGLVISERGGEDRAVDDQDEDEEQKITGGRGSPSHLTFVTPFILALSFWVPS